MALNWSWDGKVGEATVQRMFGREDFKDTTVVLYEGNALLIMLDEWEEDGAEKWNMYSFFVDEQHAKNMLGLNKKDPECYNVFSQPHQLLKKVRINKAKSHNWKKLVKLFSEAFDAITIELYSEK